MTKLDEIAGQGPVAWHLKIDHKGIILFNWEEVVEEMQDEWAGSTIIPLYSTDPRPLVTLIRQLGDALKWIREETTQKYSGSSISRSVDDEATRLACGACAKKTLAALAAFEKEEG